MDKDFSKDYILHSNNINKSSKNDSSVKGRTVNQIDFGSLHVYILPSAVDERTDRILSECWFSRYDALESMLYVVLNIPCYILFLQNFGKGLFKDDHCCIIGD